MVLGKIFQLWSLVNVHSHNQGYKYTLSQMVKFLRSGKVLSLCNNLYMVQFVCAYSNLAFFIYFLNTIFSLLFLNIVAEKYEREAKKYWDSFYKRHQDKVSFLDI